MRTLLLLLVILVSASTASAQKKREIIPRDTITGKYAYSKMSDTIPNTKEELRAKLDKWIKQNYNPQESKYTTIAVDGDTYTIHDREALPGKARKFVEYNLTVDLKEKRYRYKLTDLEYAAVGKYPLEDKMATDERDDFEAMHAILTGVLKSLDAAMVSEW
ncbi:MAG: DUF4468 domain-containing protein [Flavobacteriales bacterium]|nr:DUF4468 domain-containing protein [Flavobacteriales bacterium]